MSDEIARLARALAPGPSPAVWRRGIVDTVDTGAKTVDVIVDGVTIPGSPYVEHVSPTAGDTVDVALLGRSPRVVGVSA